MKKPLLLLATLTLLAVSSARASDEYPWDFDFTMGGNIPDSPKLLDGAGELKLNAGFTMSLGLTYHATPWLRVGPEFVLNFNGVDQVGTMDTDGTTTLFQMPMMVNAILEPPLNSPVRPFVGLGVGGSLSVLDSSLYYWDYWYYYEQEGGSDSDFVFSWQAIAGVKWQVNDKAAFGLHYRYIWTDKQEWDYTRIGYWYNTDIPIDADSYGTHCITLLFTVSF